MKQTKLFIKGTDINIRYGKAYGDLCFYCSHKVNSLCDDCAKVVADKFVEMGFAERKEVEIDEKE